MEFLTRNPDLVEIYDAFSEKQVAEILSAAAVLSPGVINETNLTERPYGLDPSRSSSTMPLKPEDMAEKKLNRKVETMTGLRSTDLSSKEEAMVASYMPGGHSEYHTDSVSYTSLMIETYTVDVKSLNFSVLIVTVFLKSGGGATFVWGQRRSDSYFHGLCENSTRIIHYPCNSVYS